MPCMCTCLGTNPRAYCAIDPFTKQALLRIGTTPPGLNSRTAPGEVVRCCGQDIVIVNNNDSENKGKTGEFPDGKKIVQYRTPPTRRRKSPHIERFIGTFQRECLDYHQPTHSLFGSVL